MKAYVSLSRANLSIILLINNNIDHVKLNVVIYTSIFVYLIVI